MVFSQSDLSHLYRLGKMVSGHTGKKYALSDEKQILALMTYCDYSNDRAINHQYEEFISSLDPNTLSKLKTRKMKLVKMS